MSMVKCATCGNEYNQVHSGVCPQCGDDMAFVETKEGSLIGSPTVEYAKKPDWPMVKVIVNFRNWRDFAPLVFEFEDIDCSNSEGHSTGVAILENVARIVTDIDGSCAIIPIDMIGSIKVEK